ncbi:anthranilate synthase component II [Halococcoides cellulosivorans]|uniref:Anthranilate synthase component II n=1 Tax=Halococcoides cellulosivorans TaxID=1679096 RepID=A0A2R4X2C6_9EURY|nr:anthranilate synthase component II [Halococcoides cellulosivorans]AWB27941.1 anthranilate/aminodeoxychorismate synthase component II [Halococcoides cellulosivorans]
MSASEESAESERSAKSERSAEDERSEETDTTILVIDNFDSFTYNLVEYLSEHGVATPVLRNTATVEEVRAIDPDGIVISPGPGHPKNDRDVGVSTAVLREIAPEIPTMGVCLGLEAAVHAYGGTVGRAPAPIHGKAASITHDATGLFDGLDDPVRGGRYHSLIAADVPDAFAVTATATDDGEELVMGIRHREHPIHAVQFHPESVLTGVGHDVVANFLDIVSGVNP